MAVLCLIRMKHLKYILSIVIISLVIVCAFVYCVSQNAKKTGLEIVKKEISNPYILFVPGFKSKGTSSEEYYSLIKDVFQESEIEIVRWESGNSTLDWQIAIDNAELFSENLFERIEKMEPSKRENLVLIGHSLGGRIVIRTLAKLADQGCKIRRGIFLAAAIPDDDSDISKAIKATCYPCVNIYSRDDYVLRKIYGTMGENTDAYMKCALGAYGSRLRYPDLALLEIKVESSYKGEKQEDTIQDDMYKSHYAARYVRELRKNIHDKTMRLKMFPPMSPRRWSLQKDSWEKEEEEEGWILLKHNYSKQCKIVSPEGNVSVLDDECIVRKTFEDLKENLKQIKKQNLQIIKVENEEDILMRVIPTGNWTTEEECNGWLLQRSLLGKYRIVDAHDFQRAHGNKEQMIRVFEDIKSQFEDCFLQN